MEKNKIGFFWFTEVAQVLEIGTDLRGNVILFS